VHFFPEKKVTTSFSRRPQKQSKTPKLANLTTATLQISIAQQTNAPNLPHSAKMSSKIGLLLCLGALTTFPCKLRQFFPQFQTAGAE